MNKQDLSRPKQWLIERCQHINFGSITLDVRGGEPDLTRPHRVTRTLKLAGGDNEPRPEVASADFELRQEHIALLMQLARLPDGTCVKIKLAHGLPGTAIDVEEDHRGA